MLMKNNDIHIIHGTDYKNMTIRLLEQAGLADLIGDRKKKIGMKPNLVVAKDPSQGATTHGELLEGVICYLQNNGFPEYNHYGRFLGGRQHSRSLPCGGI